MSGEDALPLERSRPSSEGVAAEGIAAFLDALESTPGVEPHSLMLLRRGRLIASGWWRPYRRERVHLLYSLSKSFTSTAAALAGARGLIDLDARVIDYFPELEPDVSDERRRALRLRHLASMATGDLEDTWPLVSAGDDDERVRTFLRLSPARDPGTVFAYNQSATYTLAAIVQKATKRPLSSYLAAELGDLLGGAELRWLRDATGNELGFSGLHATTETVARLGELYRRRGRIGGSERLPGDFVAAATTSQVDNRPLIAGAGEPKPDWEQGYGYQFWISRHGYRGDGAFGQFCLVLPEQEAVVAMTGQSTDMQAVLDAAWRHLLPAFEAPRSSGAGGDDALAERLEELSLPAPPLEPALPERHRELPASLSPAGGRCLEQPSLTGVRLERHGEAWTAVVQEAGLALEVPLRPGWSEAQAPGPSGTVPYASAGGFAGPSTVVLELTLLETPHRLAITCSLEDASFEARWQTAPLHAAALATLHAPKRSGAA